MRRRSVADKLAHYASEELGVLAPRGWHWRGYERSDSSTLVVDPEPLSGDSDENPPVLAFLTLCRGLDGRRSKSGGGRGRTSLSGQEKACIETYSRVGHGQKLYVRSIPRRRRNDSYVEYETPANKDGMGTRYRLVKNADPIRGLAKVYELKDGKGEAPSVVLLDVRNIGTFLSNGSVRLIWTVDRFRRGLCLRPGAWATFFAGSGGVGALCHGDASQEQQSRL